MYCLMQSEKLKMALCPHQVDEKPSQLFDFFFAFSAFDAPRRFSFGFFFIAEPEYFAEILYIQKPNLFFC